MKIDTAPNFERQFKKLDSAAQARVRAAIESILAYFDQRSPLRPGLGLKNFKKNLWEIRVDIRNRIVFELTDQLTFWMIGNHDDVRRFMKTR